MSNSFNIVDIFKSFKSNSQPTRTVKTVAITGSSGVVAKELISNFEAKGVKVIQISSSLLPNNEKGILKWDIVNQSFADIDKLEGVDVVIHLAGENVASGAGPLAFTGRWTEEKKKTIIDSRVQGTKLLIDSIKTLSKKPKLLISASAVGYYGYSEPNKVFNEKDDVGEGFLADVCKMWEEEAFKAETLGIRTVCTRFAPILSKNSGILGKLTPIFGLGVGGILGDGKQGLSWVTINDVVRSIQFIIDNNSLRGPVNICGPQPVSNKDFTLALGNALSRPTVLPVPAVAAGVLLGEMGQEMLLGGQNVVPSKLTAAGFKFESETIQDALNLILKN
eukprot:gene13773-18472_t